MSSADKPRPLPKRFYQTASVAEVTGQPATFRILLDGRAVRTPAKHELAVPSRALAEAIAAEWQRQGDTINAPGMRLTRMVNTARDGVTGREDEVRADIAAYAGSDLVCYLAAGPVDLVARQTNGWGPLHRWLADELGVRLRLARGVMHVAQDAALIERVTAALGHCDALALTALHVITTLTGSAGLALACARRHLDVEQAWTLAHIDEDYQIERWGQDYEAKDRRDARHAEMLAAGRLLALS